MIGRPAARARITLADVSPIVGQRRLTSTSHAMRSGADVVFVEVAEVHDRLPKAKAVFGRLELEVIPTRDAARENQERVRVPSP